MRITERLGVVTIAMFIVTTGLGPGALRVDAFPSRQIEPAVIDTVVPAVVQIAVHADRVFADGQRKANLLMVGSGTIISSDGLVLTAAHVVDFSALRIKLAEKGQIEAALLGDFHYELNDTEVLIFGTDGYHLPDPRYTATILEENRGPGVALLQITSDDLGHAYDQTRFALPFVPLGQTDAVRIGEVVAIVSYPGTAGGGITTTRGVVSGFRFEDEQHPRRRTAILTDATVSGGSSGGAAVNARGELIGIVLSATHLECRASDPFDETRCLPSGGSMAILRPIGEVRAYLARIGYADRLSAAAAMATPSILPTS